MRVLAILLVATCCVGLAPLAQAKPPAISPEHRARAEAMAARAIEYLRTQQDAETGEWSRNPGGPALPAISGLVLTGMLLDHEIHASDPHVRKGLNAILAYQQQDGGIYDSILPSYNTAICLSTLALAMDESGQRLPAAEDAIKPAQAFLIGLQYSEDAIEETGDELNDAAARTTARVDRSHPFYGGVGYGRNGRPDNSNLNLMLQALHDSGVPADHAAYQRALVFLERTQMDDRFNDMPYADHSQQGGFIYATSPNATELGRGESKAGEITETPSGEQPINRLRAYGSMTYAGFKSFAYAGLTRTDPRVIAARKWIERHYTLEENPGIGNDGLYYYFMTFARSLHAWGEPFVNAGGRVGVVDERSWRNDLIERLEGLQRDDGSFNSVDDRWMENDPVLITAYALIAIQHALLDD
ncbi:MAG: hypothetical protein AAGK04_05740 [Planctomycetota bacterium]